jgi:ABC-2 type transport system ATP-binding protein
VDTVKHAAVILADDVRKAYPRGVQALDGMSFHVGEGTLFGLLGPNGAGKSTTVKVLSTLAHADSGTAYVAGFDVARHPAEVRRRIGVVGQKLSAMPVLTPKENVELQGRMHGISGRVLRQRTAEVLDRLALGEVAGRQSGRCSGGMRRRIDIAMGLVHRPELLFLDEPTTGLDPDIRAALWENLSALVHEDGLTILLTTHYLEEADRLATRVAIVDHGRVVAQGAPDDLKRQLRGDTLRVALAPAAGHGDVEATRQRVARALDTVRGLTDVRVNGDTVEAGTADGSGSVPAVLAALERAGRPATAVTVSRPTLDDVYLRHTGRRLADASTGGEVPA